MRYGSVASAAGSLLGRNGLRRCVTGSASVYVPADAKCAGRVGCGSVGGRVFSGVREREREGEGGIWYSGMLERVPSGAERSCSAFLVEVMCTGREVKGYASTTRSASGGVILGVIRMTPAMSMLWPVQYVSRQTDSALLYISERKCRVSRGGGYQA